MLVHLFVFDEIVQPSMAKWANKIKIHLGKCLSLPRSPFWCIRFEVNI